MGYDLAHNEFGDKCLHGNNMMKLLNKRVKMLRSQSKAEQEGKIIIKDSIADIFLQQILTRPAEHDVVATMNLNGDYISDAPAAQVGGIGIAPGANINYETDMLF